jgi:uncharacterized protein (TIGR03086 family)
MDLTGTFLTAQTAFSEQVHAVGDGQWRLATPDTEWTVSDLVRHLVDEHRWAGPLLAGQSMEAAEATVAALALEWDQAAASSAHAFGGSLDGTVEITRGTVPAVEYLEEMILDLVVHAWDLGTAIGPPVRLPDDAVSAIYPLARAIVDRTPSGMFAPPVTVRADAPLADRLIALTGRQPA